MVYHQSSCECLEELEKCDHTHAVQWLIQGELLECSNMSTSICFALFQLSCDIQRTISKIYTYRPWSEIMQWWWMYWSVWLSLQMTRCHTFVNLLSHKLRMPHLPKQFLERISIRVSLTPLCCIGHVNEYLWLLALQVCDPYPVVLLLRVNPILPPTSPDLWVVQD